jgi:hypothetical protein
MRRVGKWFLPRHGGEGFNRRETEAQLYYKKLCLCLSAVELRSREAPTRGSYLPPLVVNGSTSMSAS